MLRLLPLAVTLEVAPTDLNSSRACVSVCDSGSSCHRQIAPTPARRVAISHEAKRRLVPMIVVDCVRDVDPRGMPYLGNVPVVRMDPGRTDRIGTVAGCLLDEVFRSWLWLCRVAPYIANSPGVLFTPRPPELIALAAVPSCGEDSVPAIVYPEPLLATDEERLFREIAPGVRVQTLSDWLEERR